MEKYMDDDTTLKEQRYAKNDLNSFFDFKHNGQNILDILNDAYFSSEKRKVFTASERI